MVIVLQAKASPIRSVGRLQTGGTVGTRTTGRLPRQMPDGHDLLRGAEWFTVASDRKAGSILSGDPD